MNDENEINGHVIFHNFKVSWRNIGYVQQESST